MARSLVHPRQARSLANHYPSAVTIQANTPTGDSYGAEVESWAAVTGLEELACAVAPIAKDKQRGPQKTLVNETHHVSLPEYYNTITTDMRAVVETPEGESLTLTILAVEHDSLNTQTRIRAEEVHI